MSERIECRTHGQAFVVGCPDCDASLFLALFIAQVMQSPPYEPKPEAQE
jgi:hypothetical protein